MEKKIYRTLFLLLIFLIGTNHFSFSQEFKSSFFKKEMNLVSKTSQANLLKNFFLKYHSHDYSLKGSLFSQNTKNNPEEESGVKLEEESEDGYSILLYFPLPVLLIALIIYDLVDKKRKRKKQ